MKKYIKILLIMILIGFVVLISLSVRPKVSNSIQNTPNASLATDTASEKPQDSVIGYIQGIRKALNLYIDNNYKGTVADVVIEGNGNPGTGLKAFSRDYFKSKYFVYMIKNSVAGGKEMLIIFVDKPDKIFNTWIYNTSDGNYELRAFGENTNISKDTIQQLLNNHKEEILNSQNLF